MNRSGPEAQHWLINQLHPGKESTGEARVLGAVIATTLFKKQKRWLYWAIVALLSNAACSAQAPNTSVPEPLEDAGVSETVSKTAPQSSLQHGEYATEKGWGRLQLAKNGESLMFSIQSVLGEDICALSGKVKDGRGIAEDDKGPSACSVNFAQSNQGVEISTSTPSECKRFCGHNGAFEGAYLRVKNECSQHEIQQTRAAFKHLYDNKDYKSALTVLEPVLPDCLPTLEWEEEGSIRNDLALTQYKNGLYNECLETLEQYAEDARKDDDAVIEGWSPLLADRYLSIVKAARTNIGLCSRNAKNHTGKLFDGDWVYAKKCDSGQFVSIEFKQSVNKVSGTWSEGTRLRGSDGLLKGTIRNGKLFVQYCGNDEESGYAICPQYDEESDHFLRNGEDLIRFQKYGNRYQKDIVLHRHADAKEQPMDDKECQKAVDPEKAL